MYTLGLGNINYTACKIYVQYIRVTAGVKVENNPNANSRASYDE
jgi:hypothetical protein